MPRSVTAQLTATLEGHRSAVDSVAFSPDGKTLASGSEDGTVKLWDPQTASLKSTLSGFQGGLMNVAYSPDGRTLAVGSVDGTGAASLGSADRPTAAHPAGGSRRSGLLAGRENAGDGNRKPVGY